MLAGVVFVDYAVTTSLARNSVAHRFIATAALILSDHLPLFQSCGNKPITKNVASTKNGRLEFLATTFSENLALESKVKSSKSEGKMNLNTLPYDLLLNIAARLDIQDVHALHLVSVFTDSITGYQWFCGDPDFISRVLDMMSPSFRRAIRWTGTLSVNRVTCYSN